MAWFSQSGGSVRIWKIKFIRFNDIDKILQTTYCIFGYTSMSIKVMKLYKIWRETASLAVLPFVAALIHSVSGGMANQFLGMNGDAERNRKKGSFQLLAPTFQFLAPTSQWKGNRKCTKLWLRFFDISKLNGINAIRKPLAYNLWHATKPNAWWRCEK